MLSYPLDIFQRHIQSIFLLDTIEDTLEVTPPSLAVDKTRVNCHDFLVVSEIQMCQLLKGL
jgi:hypothetical protein